MNNKIGTFELNKSEPIHNWYSYTEGYSSNLVLNELDLLKDKNIKNVYDPFGGSGTTPLVVVQNNIEAFYSETNPFMLNIIDTKINCVKNLIDNKIGVSELIKFRNKISKLNLIPNIDIKYDGFEKFYLNDKLSILLQIKNEIQKVKDIDTKKILMLALSSITVPVSKMLKHGDLRYATEKEMEKKKNFDVKNLFIEKIDTIISDIENYGSSINNCAIKLSDDARDIDMENEIDCVITSPPYLNGTNYIRNTKLELKLNDYVNTEDGLPLLHSKGIISGINNVSKRNNDIEVLDIVKPFIEKLEPVVYDKRIVKMVACYFNDMNDVIKKLAIAMKDNGIFIMDIGDSQFAGVHIPTHEILCEICKMNGFELYDETILRERKSKNNMVLSQRILRFILHKNNNEDSFKQKAENFIRNMPYKKEPYSGRNWGHDWHSLCSYHGKLKPAIAHFLIKNFTKENDIILDPLCGVGTIPFEACLQGRIGIGNDLSEMAYVVTKAKLEKPSLEDVKVVLNKLSNYIEKNKNSDLVLNEIKLNEDFGFNGKVATYFHEDTYKEIICARKYFVDRIKNISPAEALVYSSFLHVLHGNRPYALSRTSHPLTPYAPKGEFIYKNVIEHITDKIESSYKKDEFDTYIKGSTILGDYNDISNLDNTVDFIICSPPFANSIRFYLQNWMRLWLCGWDLKKFKNADNDFIDLKQKKDFSIYDSFFKMCHKVLKENGKVILHLGKTEKIDMAEELMKYADKYFTEVYRGTEDVSTIEKHGIKDKGVTIEHEYLFLIKK